MDLKQALNENKQADKMGQHFSNALVVVNLKLHLEIEDKKRCKVEQVTDQQIITERLKVV